RLHACNADAAIKCPDPANPTHERDPGISRGMTSVGFKTTFSRRYGYVEPYTGFRLLLEFPQSNSDFRATSGRGGPLLSHPPTVGQVMMGLEVFPYERREKFERLALDFRLHGEYNSPGREYSELFDALGSSQAPSLRSPNPGAYRTGPDGVTSV